MVTDVGVPMGVGGAIPDFAGRIDTLIVPGYAIFVRDAPVVTSAGVTAGIDMALALVEEDLGAEVARSLAKSLVVFLRRPGGQSQFSVRTEVALPIGHRPTRWPSPRLRSPPASPNTSPTTTTNCCL
ncbi:helix-turn-helix domain-containing protein [Nocardia puris]|uniref:hypothetical protein n=1 Tax=Nocardia puris TaxID=208602 RepID=UPI00389A752A